MYAIKNPEGKLIVETTAQNREDAWWNAYKFIFIKKSIYRHSVNARKLAYKHGWRSVKVKVTEL